jgi:hypothetical protein
MCGEYLGVRGDPKLRVAAGADDEASERFQQVGVDAGFRLVQGEKGWWSRREERCKEREVVERAVGKLAGFERTLKFGHLEAQS